jgi:hypothetical protein
MRTHFFLSTAALTLGLALTVPAVFAQEEDPAIRRWPTAADGRVSIPAGRTAVARSAATLDVSRPAERATRGTFASGPVVGNDPISIDQGRFEQRRSPGGGGGTVRGGGGGGGGGRVAVPRGSGGGGRPVYSGGGRYPYPAGRYYGRYYAPYNRGYYPYYGYAYPYYYPYSAFYWGGGYFNSFGYWGAGVGWPGYGYPAYGYPYPAYGYGYDPNTGRVRLDVQPRDAEVFIDGAFAGKVDDFDGRLQGLTLETGSYTVEIRKPGWETLAFDVRITPGRTTSYKGELIPKKE